MGFFDFFKKKQKNSNAVKEPRQSVEHSACIKCEDDLGTVQKEFWGTITPLIKEAAEKGVIVTPKNDNLNCFNQRLDVLANDGELPYGWEDYNKKIIKINEDKLVSYATKLKYSELNATERIETLKEMISFYYSFKNSFYKKNECFKKYFIDMWEHCFNSKCDDFEYIKPYENMLSEELENYEENVRKEKIRNEFLPTLEKDILKIIKENNGILQTELYKMFPVEIKNDISDNLYCMSKDDVIKREKSGRTYKLFKN